MIQEINGDLFESDSEVYINPVNVMGIAGAGLSLQFKKRFGENYQAYKNQCVWARMKPGGIYAYSQSIDASPNWIVNFATKDHWKNPSKLEWITSGLLELEKFMLVTKVRTISMPKIGCGLGGLDFQDVKREVTSWHNRVFFNYKFILRLYL